MSSIAPKFRVALTVMVSIAALTQSMTSALAGCACGPDYCQDDTRIAAALAAKKNSLAAAGYPPRLLALLDVGTQCYARIHQAPDAFTMLIVSPNGDSQTVPWSDDDVRIANADLASGKISRYWIFNARRAFACCGEASYQDRPDYNSADDVNTSTAIKCTQSPCGQQ